MVEWARGLKRGGYTESNFLVSCMPPDSTQQLPISAAQVVFYWQHKKDEFQVLIPALTPFNKLPLIICCYLCYILNL